MERLLGEQIIRSPLPITMEQPPPPPPLPALPEEIVEAILLRVPPDDPATLIGAALVCKRWCRLVTDPGFRRRFRLFHRAAPMLGFVYRLTSATGFTPTSSFLPSGGAAVFRDWWPLDARRGRILFRDTAILSKGTEEGLMVLDPVTGEVCRLPFPWFSRSYLPWNAALLCAAAGCDHLDCAPGGPFVVIWLGTDGGVDTRFTSAWVYSSEADKWSLTARIEEDSFVRIQFGSTLVDNALYFQEGSNGILECERPSVIQLMAAEGGGLGFAGLRDLNLYMWSRDESVPSGWMMQQRVIQLRSLLPASVRSFSVTMIALAGGVGVVFIWAHDLGIFAIGLKSGQLRKVSESDGYFRVVPYMSFCTPALRAASTKHILMSGQERGASNHYGKSHICRVLKGLPSTIRQALGKQGLCRVWQEKHLAK